MSLPEALERAAISLPRDADTIRPANGDPTQLLETLDAASAGRVLSWLLDEEPAAAEELALAWAEEESGSEHLRALDTDSLSKPARKALRRVRHRLRSRGVDWPEGAAPRVARLREVEETLDLAYVSALDPRGGSIAYLVEPHPSGGARLFELVLDELRGIVDFQIYSASRSKVRRFLRDLRSRARFPTCEVEPAALRARVARCAARPAEDGRTPRGFSEWRGRLSRCDEGQPTPGELAAQALGVTDEPGRVRAVAERVTKQELGPWPPSREAMNELAEQVKTKLESPLVVSPAQKREQLDGVLMQAAERIYAETVGEVAATRLREHAYALWKGGDEEEARDCLAAARAFETQPPGENPVARAMLETVLGPALGELLAGPPEEPEASEDAESSLIVKP